jgi:uncharacterized membrane protein YhaH (DUF805 family)
MKNRKRKHDTRKNKIVALIMLILALIPLKFTTDATGTVFIIMFFVIPLLTAKENVIY